MKIRILSFTFILINALTNPLIAYLQHQYIGQETKLTRNLTRNKLDRTLFNYPIDLIFYKTGSQKVLFVSDATWCRIVSYYSERDITQYGSRTLAVELSVDTYGNVYILDENKCRILKFTPRMEELLWIYGSEGYGVNQLKWPRGLSTPYGYGDVGVVEYWTDYSGIRAYYTVISILSFTASKESFDASEDTGYTDISFKIDDVAEVSVVVLDSLGQTVKTLIDNITFPAGTNTNVCTWDGEDDEGRLVLPGNYTIKMTAVDGYGNQDVKTIPIRIKGRLIQKIATINI